MSRRKHFDEGHGNPEYTVKRHPAFDMDHELYFTDYGKSVRDYVSAGNSLERADATALVGMGDRNPFDHKGDDSEQARHDAYTGYIDNYHDMAYENPESILGTHGSHGYAHPQSAEDVKRITDDIHDGAMSNVDSYENEYRRDKD